MQKAPWSDALVQQRSDVHPYTCGNGSHVLRATREGWVCDECAKLGREYKQNWCH